MSFVFISQDYTPTIGVEFGSKIINANGFEIYLDLYIKLQIWDTAG